MASRAVTARDAGLALVSRVTRWMVAGAVGLAALISLIAAHSFHGRTLPSAGSAGSTPSGSSEASTGSGSGAGGGLAQPQQAPAPAQSAPSPVVSGGS